MSANSPRKVDVHHHVYPPIFTDALNRAGGDPSGWYIPDWTLEADKALNSKTGVKTTILSVTAPGPLIDKANPAELARQCNDFQAQICKDDPAHYGFFACLPDLLSHTKDAIEEISRALDDLHADGIVIYTRYGPGNDYLGHHGFEPIWEELNRRKAVVFIHPTHPADTNMVDKHLPQPMYDYPHETGRTAVDMICAGTLRKYPDVKVILSHAGGDLPWLIYRISMLPYTPMDIGLSVEEILEEGKKFYFDTALSGGPISMAGLRAFAKPGHILFGSDFPNAPEKAILRFTQWADGTEMDVKEKESFDYGAAVTLFPRLAQYYHE